MSVPKINHVDRLSASNRASSLGSSALTEQLSASLLNKIAAFNLTVSEKEEKTMRCLARDSVLLTFMPQSSSFQTNVYLERMDR